VYYTGGLARHRGQRSRSCGNDNVTPAIWVLRKWVSEHPLLNHLASADGGAATPSQPRLFKPLVGSARGQRASDSNLKDRFL